nr:MULTISPECIES: hypothetical protein [unclassified Frankia]
MLAGPEDTVGAGRTHALGAQPRQQIDDGVGRPGLDAAEVDEQGCEVEQERGLGAARVGVHPRQPEVDGGDGTTLRAAEPDR